MCQPFAYIPSSGAASVQTAAAHCELQAHQAEGERHCSVDHQPSSQEPPDAAAPRPEGKPRP